MAGGRDGSTPAAGSDDAGDDAGDSDGFGAGDAERATATTHGRSAGPVSDARRILVYGVTGSGKTTLARRIGELRGLPSHSVDDEVGWLPGWVERPRAEQRDIVSRIVAADRWVLDTAYSHWRDLVLSRTELIVALDYPRGVSLTRLVRRTVRRTVRGEETCNGNTETWRKVVSSDSILAWHFRSFAHKRAQISAWDSDPTAPPLVRLRSVRETERWLATLDTTPTRANDGRGAGAP